jgi:hypothetical protein
MQTLVCRLAPRHDRDLGLRRVRDVLRDVQVERHVDRRVRRHIADLGPML